MTETLRLSKYLAAHFSCSRREAENYISGGWVSVDGHVIEEPGHRVRPGQRIELAEGASSDDREPVTILLHKPGGDAIGEDQSSAIQLISQSNHAASDRSGRRLVKRDLVGLELVTPLAADASGLIVLTQEHVIARKLIKDAARTEQEYVVDVEGTIAEGGLKRLCSGLSWHGTKLPAIKVSWQNETRLRFALKHAPDGLIQDMCAQVGLRVTELKRIRVGRLSMSDLPVGQWRFLLGYERF
jgi:23S rRNA pseudouridine2604 synthase